jgi:hypothetical protein
LPFPPRAISSSLSEQSVVRNSINFPIPTSVSYESSELSISRIVCSEKKRFVLL